MRKLFVLILLLAIVAVPVYLLRGTISSKLMQRAALTAMLTDSLAKLDDGLHLVLCGAGSPLPDPNRSGPCVAVIAGKSIFVVDAGSGGARNLGLIRYPLGNIEAVFLTHFHSDHIDGLGELATLRWVQGNHTSPLPVYGPPGVADIVSGFNAAYARDAVYRNDHHGDAVAPLSGHGMAPLRFEVPPDAETAIIYDQDGISVEAFGVDHTPVSPAVGYVFRYKNRSIVISGDTSRSASLEAVARKADLLVHEALSPELVGIINQAASMTNNKAMERITLDILDYHASPVEAAQSAKAAEVRHLLYYHVVPALPLPGLEAAWLEGVEEIFPAYTMGRDGTTISLPAGSREVVVVRSGL
jgi:ribonuclease Z